MQKNQRILTVEQSVFNCLHKLDRIDRKDKKVYINSDEIDYFICGRIDRWIILGVYR